MSQPESIKPKQAKNKKLMLVRYGRMGHLGWFEHNESHVPKTSSRVVVKTDRGLELGEIVGPYCYRSGNFKFSPDQVKNYFGPEVDGDLVMTGGEFVRHATGQDLSEERHLNQSAEEEIKCCRQFVKEMDLSMKVVDSEHLFGGERVIFYFVAESRVDFRELVKRLAKEYQTRIEMRQIGARDEAKLIADYETCGMECCCRKFLKILKPVNMRMAKLQKATLDPSKISGHCGRLKCCLRYEDQTYTQLKKKLPRKNTLVETKQGKGKVIDQQVLTQLVVIHGEKGAIFTVPVEEITILKEASVHKDKKKSIKEEQRGQVEKQGISDSEKPLAENRQASSEENGGEKDSGSNESHNTQQDADKSELTGEEDGS